MEKSDATTSRRQRLGFTGDGVATSFLLKHDIDTAHVIAYIFNSDDQPGYMLPSQVGKGYLRYDFEIAPKEGERFTVLVIG